MTGVPLPLHELIRRATPRPRVLMDAHGRVKRKLRISLTDRCNFRCRYCMPEEPSFLPRRALLSRNEVAALARTFIDELGINQIRLTGGEPLLRRDLAGIVEDLAALRDRGLARISLTSNGALLERSAAALKSAGLDDLNVSLDARTSSVFHALTGADVAPVLRGIDAARRAGLAVKINAVIIRGYNDHEIVPLARWALDEGLELRFIEFMPLDGRGFWSADKVVSERELLAILAPHFALDTLPRDTSPATRYRLERPLRGRGAGTGSIGVISTVSNPFCASCDRVRLTANGELYTCLFAERGTDLATALRNDPAALVPAIRAAVWNKDAGYVARSGYAQRPIAMNHLGG